MMEGYENALNRKSPAWLAVGAAVQGTSHQKNGLPCQDYQELHLLEDGALLIALADGAGTAGLADAGARCAVDVALEVMESVLKESRPEDEGGWASLMLQAFYEAQVTLQRLADEMNTPLREFATTLTCVIASDGWLATGQLGDGAVVARDSRGTLFSVAQGQRGEYANETFFLTQEDALQELVISILQEPVDALAVMSDGLTRLALKMPAYEPHLPFFQPLFAFTSGLQEQSQAEQQLAAFLSSARVSARTDDDKSLVLAVRYADRAREEGQEESQVESEIQTSGRSSPAPEKSLER